MAPQTQEWTPHGGLSKRALEILRLLAVGLSDREIAEGLVMTIGTVKWYNRQIYRALGVGSRTQAIASAKARGLLEQGAETAPRAPLPFQIVRRAPAHNLPVDATPFIGRENEIAVVRRLLEATHMLTLVGPPGTGKTRLALQVAWEVADTFREGAYFVSLAPINDPALVLSAIANTLGVNEAPGQPLIATVKQALRESSLLLVLDNCEHVLAAAPNVAELLATAPHLKVLATSREPLHLRGEQEYAVPPLELPDLDDHQQLAPDVLATCEAAALFVQQARAVRSNFGLTADNAADVARICVRLDGLPLAIELAAVRIKLLPPHALLSRLNRRLNTLISGAHDLPVRQQTLQNTIAWSYNLLNAREKTLFARLAIFQGGCSLEAIEAVCSDDQLKDVLAQLTTLVDKSLVQQKETSDGEPRFVMLETIREYARERLGESGEAETLARRHAEYFVDLAERAEPELRRAQQWRWFRLLNAEHDNLRAVLSWSLETGDRTLGARLAGAIYLFWFANGYHIEGRQWAQQLLEALDQSNTAPTKYYARLLLSAGHMNLMHDLEVANRHFDRSIQMSRAVGATATSAWALGFLSYTVIRDMEAAIAVAEEGLALFRELGDQPGVAQILNIIGEIARVGGDGARAWRAYEECLDVARETGETRRIRFISNNLMFLALHGGDYARARAFAEQGLRIALEMGNKLDIADSLAGFAGVLGGTGNPEQGARLLGAWQMALERLGAAPMLADSLEHDRAIAVVRSHLDPATFEAAWTEGRAMSLEEAVALANEGRNILGPLESGVHG